GVAAALAPHHQCGLAGESAVDDVTVDAFGEMPRECRLAGARIAEQAKDLRRAGFARPRLEPGRARLEGGVLMRGEDGHGARGNGLLCPPMRCRTHRAP